MTDSTEKRELDLVDKVDFRILEVANNEQKLEQLLSRYLAPLVLKAGSPHASVRAKVIAVLKRVTTFVQPPGIVLPVAALIDQFKSNSSPVVKQFDLVFIQHSVPRMDVADRRDLFPKVTKEISHGDADAAGPSDAGFFDIFLRLLTDVKFPGRGTKDDVALRETLGLTDSDAKYLSKWLGKVLLLKSAGAGATADALRGVNPPPTFTASELDFLVPTHRPVSAAFTAIADLRLKAISFLASGAFKDSERFIPALYAASATDSRVSSIGDELLKKSSVDLEDATLVKSLFDSHSRLGPAYRTRILGILSKSTVSTTMTAEILEAAKLDIAPVDAGSAEQTQRQGTLERTKLHRALFQYLRWAATVGPTKGKFDIGYKLLEKMQEFIKSQGWPVAEKTSADDVALRSLAYESIGILGKVATMTAQQRFTLSGWIFRSLAEDPNPEVVVNIDGAVSMLTALYPPEAEPSYSNIFGIRTLLLNYMNAKTEPPVVRSVRHAAVKWANKCLPFDSAQARWIDILAVGARSDERSDVIEEGQKGLDPWAQYAHSPGADVKLPDWKEMLFMYFDGWLQERPQTDSNNEMDLDTDIIPQFRFSDDNILAFPIAINYCKQMLLLAALKDFKMDPDWTRNLQNLVNTDLNTRNEIREYLAKLPDGGHIMYFLKRCLDGLNLKNEATVEEAARSFTDVASLSPLGAVAYLANLAPQLIPFVKSNKKELRVLAAEAFGVLAAHPANGTERISQLIAPILELTKDSENKFGAELNAAEGATLAFAHFYSRLVFYGREIPAGTTYPLDLLVKERIPPSLKETLLEAFAQLWSAGLGAPSAESGVPAKVVIDLLLGLGKKGNEKAISALGKLAIALKEENGETKWDEGLIGSILNGLFGLYEIKQAEVHFAVGEAIAAAVGRWDADCVKLGLNVDSPGGSFKKPHRPAHLTGALDKFIQDCKGTKPSLLKASGIWLFCIVQYCPHLEEVKSRLREIQAAFMRLLHTRDELTQETASRGLSLVYEKGDESVRGQLTKDLVSAFTGSSTTLKVDEDTELFDAGALPTGDGKSITSYKDIVNLASEVGDQTLVYKFMSLATNAAMWTTRSAFGRFGLSNILSESEVDPKLYPKLYRYRFDPNTNVQRSMDDIWKSIVKDSNAVLEKHFDAIMEDLLKSALGREWRMREASCGAIADLVQGRPFPKYEKYYTEIWKVALKLMDDVKGSVRAAALKLCIGLSNGLLRLLEESTGGSSVQAMLKEVIPFLLSSQGVDNSVEDVKLFSTLTLINIAKKGGRNLRPFMSEMIPQLLGLLSTIEPEQIGFYYQRVGEGGRELIDKRRAAMVSQSPISEAIENCLRFVDDETLTELAPTLEATIKSALGMPTKIGCSRMLITLFSTHANAMRPLAARFLQLMEKQTLDANDEVSKSYARAAAYIIRAAPADAKEKFCTKCLDLYFSAEDERRRQKVADVTVALAKSAPDQFTSMASLLLPFAYFASNDVDQYTRTAFAVAWDQHAGGSRTVAWHLPEIVALVTRGLDAPRWSLQHTACFTIATAIEALAGSTEATGQISETNIKVVWPVFDRALALKTFDGKERLLKAFPPFVEKGEVLWKDGGAAAVQQRKIALREAKRNNAGYKVHAYVCLWKFAKARKDLELLDDVIDIVQPALDEFEDEAEADKMDVDSKEDGEHAAALAENAFEAIVRGYNRRKMAEEPINSLSTILKTLKPYLKEAKFSLIRRKVWFTALIDAMDDAKAKASKDESALAKAYIDTLSLDVVEAGTEVQRIERAKAVGAVARAWKRGVFGQKEGIIEVMRGAVEKIILEERSMAVKDALKKALEEMK
ncbi:hypothetical protein jhhlp_007079 [Lomentospora prolificans]|uniref:Proteasome component ECM29 n=1 Tax=Lomentospora prolificans TaxID=41688 RepID=A0A2N3N1P9_9PEZI|nr:hypothetical protein jhhlp_007079 [Lomentospora prolificans]